ncbi:nucleotidyltransferase [Petrocella sp. FN5]|uniref:nucleotidyltransferase n=1 Tax=Petrocella sp. FN5 TaxID=3032002 RepID=UPI0023DB7279|nr:nucleotidyltransferase [Petrocella sp. FN5]MDF1616399.1 nucleotidyltransferase [Petrocella sp. FN5]
MNICGIVTEYNPLHLGHAYQIQAARTTTEAQGVVLIMSGNFVQRGEPAIINKYARTQAALHTGVDLVIELPTYFATSSAEYFSHMAIKLLQATGITTHLNFGSESGSIDALVKIAEVLYKEPIGFRFLLNEYLGKGDAFPKAREKALLKYVKNHHLMSTDQALSIKTPNNILGIEYIKALLRQNSKIIPTTIKRIGSEYHDDDSKTTIPSATAIRKYLREHDHYKPLSKKLPLYSYNTLENVIISSEGPIFYDMIFPFLKYKILTSTPEVLRTYQDVNEGLENKIIEAALHAYDYESLVDRILSKRYTRTKVARALLHIYLGHEQKTFEVLNTEMKPYLKVLGFNPKGQEMLKAIKKYDENLPIIVNTRQGCKQLDDLQLLSYKADLNSTLHYNHLIHFYYGTKMENEYETPIIRLP